jgi:hypothetical protein
VAIEVDYRKEGTNGDCRSFNNNCEFLLGRRIRWSVCFFTPMTDLRFINLRVKL